MQLSMMKNVYTIVMITALAASSFVAAATTSFKIEVSPNPFDASEFVDVTITALDDNGNTSTDYDGDAWLGIVWWSATDPEFVIPWWGIVFFEPENFWIVTYSKWLSIKKAWTYTLEVEDLFDPVVRGEVEIQVIDDTAGPAVGALVITEPAQWATLLSDTIDVVWSTTYPNTPLTLMIDGVKVADGLSDQQGSFVIPVSGLTPGSRTLQVNALDLNDQIVASSEPRQFTIEIDTSTLLLWVEVLPGQEVTIRETVTFTIRTSERVTAALLTIGDGTSLPTTQQSPGVFTKQVLMDTLGTFSLDVTAMVWAESNFFEDAGTITVNDEVRSVIDLSYKADDTNSRATLQWLYEWVIDFYKVRYGTSRDNLRLSLTTNKLEGIIVLADPTIPYYAQVFPVDAQWETNGQPSDLITIWPLRDPEPVCGNELLEQWEQCDDGNTTLGDGCDAMCQIQSLTPVCGNAQPEEGEQCDDGNLLNDDGCDSTCQIEVPEAVVEEVHESAPAKSSCNTNNIPLETMQVNGQYYISWDDVDKAVSYIVYRADKSVSTLSQMSVVSRTTSTTFEYPFDPDSEIDQYAWYAVEAICENNDQKQIGNITAIKVGPEHTVLFILGLLVAGVMTARVVKV